jgi:hypothetical protein
VFKNLSARLLEVNPVRLVEPTTSLEYVILRAEVYDRLKEIEESEGALAPRRLFQERLESGLFEVMITGQSVRDLVVGHNDKGDAISQGPLFVGTRCVQIETPLENRGRWPDDRDRRVGFEPANQGHGVQRCGGAANASATSVRTQAVVRVRPV